MFTTKETSHFSNLWYKKNITRIITKAYQVTSSIKITYLHKFNVRHFYSNQNVWVCIKMPEQFDPFQGVGVLKDRQEDLQKTADFSLPA